jgi:uncharacterized membrane protein YesL
MWQVLAHAGFVIATIGIGYGYLLVFSLYKKFPNTPRNQVSYAVLTNFIRCKRRILIFFAILGVLN